MAHAADVVQTARENCPVEAATAVLTTPPSNICHAAEVNTSTLSVHRCDRIDPKAQLKEEKIRMAAPNNCTRPRWVPEAIFGHSRISMPPMPKARPNKPRAGILPTRKTQVSSTTTQMGTMATINAAKPLETYCSAHSTPTLAIESKRTPIARSRTKSSRLMLIFRPVSAHHNNISRPEIM